MGLFQGAGGLEDAGVAVAGADDLQPDGEPVLGGAAGDAGGGLLGHVEGVGEGGPAGPAGAG